MKEIQFRVPAENNSSRPKSLIRVSDRHYDAIVDIAKMTHLPMKQIADRLLEEALKHVQLVEIPLYEMRFKEE